MVQNTTVDDRIQAILASMKDKLGGVVAIFLLDLQTSKVSSQYPKNESSSLEFIGQICCNSIGKLENEADDLKQQFYITEMELVTQDQHQVYAARISQRDLLCIIGDNRNFRTGFAKRLVEENVKIDIVTTLERMGVMTSQRR